MLEQVQIIKNEQDIAEYAIIPYAEYQQLYDLLHNHEKLTAYLTLLHIQNDSPVTVVDEGKIHSLWGAMADQPEVMDEILADIMYRRHEAELCSKPMA